MTEARYYTTQNLKQIFVWSLTTLKRKQENGFIPPPDLKGRPNKWLKSKIDAIVESEKPADEA